MFLKIKKKMPLASFAKAKLAFGIFCLGTVASFDGGMTILIQRHYQSFRFGLFRQPDKETRA